MAEARIVRHGDGDVYEQFWKFKHGSLRGGRFDFMVGDIAYLEGPPLHVHREQDDTFFVLEGVLTVQVGEELFELGPGDFATVPPGIPHTFGNVHRDRSVVKAINLMTPGGLDAEFRDMASVGDSESEPDEVARLRETHGTTVVGPTLSVKLGLA